MEQAIASRTALSVALRRAAHQIYDSPVVFDDPIAVAILGATYAEELQRTPLRPDRPFSIALRAFLVARSRYAEDKLKQAVEGGVEQYVLLGAGLDTFAYRNPYPQLRVFEIDHPATQQWKRQLLQHNGIAIPDSITYTPVDFERQSLSAQLRDTGFDSHAPAFFCFARGGSLPDAASLPRDAKLRLCPGTRKRPDFGLRTTALGASATRKAGARLAGVAG